MQGQYPPSPAPSKILGSEKEYIKLRLKSEINFSRSALGDPLAAFSPDAGAAPSPPCPGIRRRPGELSRAFQADARRPCLRRRSFQTLVGEPRRAPPRSALQFRGGGEGWDFHHDSYLCYYCLLYLNLQLSLHICPNLGEVQSEGRPARGRASGFPLCRFSRDP